MNDCGRSGRHCLPYGHRRAEPQRDQADRAGVFLFYCMRARSRPPSVFPLHPAHEMIESDGAASTVSECVQNRRCCYTCAHPGMHNLPCRIAVLTSFGFASGFASAFSAYFTNGPVRSTSQLKALEAKEASKNKASESKDAPKAQSSVAKKSTPSRPAPAPEVTTPRATTGGKSLGAKGRAGPVCLFVTAKACKAQILSRLYSC